MTTVKYIFSIGYRCNTDDFMKSLNIRKYSSPFSYMICDLESSLDFINNNFIDFTDNYVFKPIDAHNLKWGENKWQHDLFFNYKTVPENDNISVNEMKRVCCWNHHYLNDNSTILTLKRRYNRLLESLHSDTNTLLMYIENIQTYIDDTLDNYINIPLLLNFIKNRPNVHFCIIVPLINYPKDPQIFKIHEQINVIVHITHLLGGNDFGRTNVPWDKISNLVRESYTFDLVD